MLKIIVTLKDTETNEEIVRELDYSNFSLPGIHIDDRPRQRNELEGWIIDRGNYQHATKLELIDWMITPKGSQQYEQYSKIESNDRFLSVDVYRSGTDCSLNGVTAPNSGLDLVIEHPSGPITGSDVVTKGYIVLDIKTKELWPTNLRDGAPETYFYARPLCLPSHKHAGMGGNFIYSSDSYFRQLYQRPIPVHDRVEG